MSLILEALKKSESRRRLGEAPDLGTPFTVTRQRRNPLPLIVILIAVAAGIGWWYLRAMPPKTEAGTIAALPSPPDQRQATGRNPANAQRAAPSAARTPPPAAAPARESAAVSMTQPKADAPAAASIAKAPARADGSAANPGAAGRLADPQAMRATNRQPAAVARVPTTTNPNPPAAPAAAVPAPLARVATTPSTPAPAPGPPPATPKADSNATAPAQVNAAKASPDTGAPRPADAPAALPLYYELAYGVRKDIPPFALSMHVFAADAAGRFVVVDGERKVEGDSVKEGLVLREIRPDGMVLEFRGQRFFYPRPGH